MLVDAAIKTPALPHDNLFDLRLVRLVDWRFQGTRRFTVKLKTVEPTMKPNSSKLIWTKPYTELESLLEVLESAVEDTIRHPSEIGVNVCSDGDRCEERTGNIVVLEAECLTDGSIVYDVYIH